jgi:hypothetical protein
MRIAWRIFTCFPSWRCSNATLSELPAKRRYGTFVANSVKTVQHTLHVEADCWVASLLRAHGFRLSCEGIVSEAVSLSVNHQAVIFHWYVFVVVEICSNTKAFTLIVTLATPNTFEHVAETFSREVVIEGLRRKLYKQTPWPESESELYRLSDRRLSAKIVPTFADRVVPRGQRGGSIRSYSRFSSPEPLLFLSSSSSVVLTKLSGLRSRPTTSQKIW